MKKSVFFTSLILASLLFGSFSCSDPEPFYQVKAIEDQVYNEIKTFREANGLNGAFVHQYPMSAQAQVFSANMAAYMEDPDTTGIFLRWEEIHDMFGGSNDHTLLQRTTATTAPEIAAFWTQDSILSQQLLGDFTQCGVGVAQATDQTVYVTVLLMLYED